MAYAVIDSTGNQVASLHADVRMNRGVTTACEIFDAEAVAKESDAFEAIKNDFRAEVEEAAAACGAVML